MQENKAPTLPLRRLSIPDTKHFHGFSCTWRSLLSSQLQHQILPLFCVKISRNK